MRSMRNCKMFRRRHPYFQFTSSHHENQCQYSTRMAIFYKFCYGFSPTQPLMWLGSYCKNSQPALPPPPRAYEMGNSGAVLGRLSDTFLVHLFLSSAKLLVNSTAYREQDSGSLPISGTKHSKASRIAPAGLFLCAGLFCAGLSWRRPFFIAPASSIAPTLFFGSAPRASVNRPWQPSTA